jgi:hypothetical protein
MPKLSGLGVARQAAKLGLATRIVFLPFIATKTSFATPWEQAVKAI